MGRPVRYTDQQLRDFARKVVEVDTQDPDFIGVSEQFEEEWADLPQDEFEEVHSKVHSLACNAVVTVTFPGEPTGMQRLAERVRALPTVYMDGVEAVPVGELYRALDEAEQDGGAPCS